MALTEEQRAGIKKCKVERKGRKCQAPAMVGLDVCYLHGGALPGPNAKSKRIKAERELTTAMERFVIPLDIDDPEANPVAAFETEFRRTLGRIRWYDDQLAHMEAEDLIWGKTKVEDIGASEFSGVNKTWEAKANAIHELQFRERQHLLAMEKIWLGAKMDERKLDIQRAYVRALDGAIIGILSALGHDTSDPGVRQVVRDNLLALPVRSTREIEAKRGDRR
jgi:hypothetical protein